MFYVPIKIKKKDKESTAALLRRFTRLVQKSGVLIEARKNQFYRKRKSRRQLREGARRREIILKEREVLLKAGLVEEGQPIPKERIRRMQQEGKL